MQFVDLYANDADLKIKIAKSKKHSSAIHETVRNKSLEKNTDVDKTIYYTIKVDLKYIFIGYVQRGNV